MTIEDLLAPFKARAEAATKGPWRWRNTGEPMLMGERSRLVMGFSRMGMNGAQPEFRNADGLMVKAGKQNINDYADAVFIAAARTDIPRLLGALEGVLALHTSIDYPGVGVVCTHCEADYGGVVDYPCPTVAAVVAALEGGETHGKD